MTSELVPVKQSAQVLTSTEPLPALVADAGGAARFAWDEFFSGQIRNPHTRRAYSHAVRQFLAWAEGQGVELVRITPGLVGQYLDQLTNGDPPRPLGIPTKKLHLAALRQFFDALVLRHVVVLNPAASVRGARYQVVEGKTPEIAIDQARTLLQLLDRRIDDARQAAQQPAAQAKPDLTLVALRDRAIVGVLVYTAARREAVAGLRRGNFAHDGTQWTLRFTEKGGKEREIPVHHDLERTLLAWIEAAGLKVAAKESPLFRTMIGKTGKLSARGVTGGDIGRLVKRRLRDAKLPDRLSPHSFRVCTITDLLEQGQPLEDVQKLAGHADPRTTRLYDRRQKKVTRKLVERISV